MSGCAQPAMVHFANDTEVHDPSSTSGLKKRHGQQGHIRSLSECLEDDSALLASLDHFLLTLERRLDELEKYSVHRLDEGRARAHSLLQHIHDDCSRFKSDMLSRAHRFVAILETHIDTLPTRSSLPAKAHAGMMYLQELLGEFEDGAVKVYEREKENAMQAMESVGEAMEFAGEALAESIERAIKAARERTLITYDELPNPWRVNPYILRGYRFTETKVECVKSAFKLSNETCNIWSHAIGFMIILAIAFYFYPSSALFSEHTFTDKLISSVFFLAALKALACSTIWHTFSAISHQTTMERFACVDYSGISLLIAASILTTEYTAFYNDIPSRTVYMTLTALLGTIGVFLPWLPFFNEPTFRVPRVFFYIGLGASGFLPIFQLSLQKGFLNACDFYLPLAESLVCYLAGAFVYAAQVPERWWPGMFDWVGGSHNIWHAAVVGGILLHWKALMVLFEKAGSW